MTPPGEFVFRPLADAATTTERRGATFRAGYEDTLALLRRELDMLGAAFPRVVELALDEDQLRRDGLPRAGAQPRHPGVAVSFTGRWGPMRIYTDHFDRWRDNLRAIALGLTDLRRLDRYGITRSGEQYRGWRQLNAGDDPVAERGRAIVREHGSVAAALKATHPDLGGSREDFDAVQRARALYGERAAAA